MKRFVRLINSLMARTTQLPAPGRDTRDSQHQFQRFMKLTNQG